MSTKYGNVNGFLVISDDNRNPWTSFAHHRARGSAGGVDLVAPFGTLLRAPYNADIELREWDGTGGNTIRFWELDDTGRKTGFYDDYLHLSAFLVPRGARVKYGDIVGKSGGSGRNKRGLNDLYAYVPHLHWHRVMRGVRVNPWDYFRAGPPPIIPPVIPITPPEVPAPIIIDENEETMRQFLRERTGKTYVIAKHYVKSVADAKTNEVIAYAFDEPVRGLNEDDFERVLNAHGIPASEFLDIADRPQGGWSVERGQFAEETFGVLSRSWPA